MEAMHHRNPYLWQNMWGPKDKIMLKLLRNWTKPIDEKERKNPSLLFILQKANSSIRTVESRFKKDLNLQIHFSPAPVFWFTTQIFLKPSIAWFKKDLLEFLKSRFACNSEFSHSWIVTKLLVPERIYNSHYGNGVPAMFIC